MQTPTSTQLLGERSACGVAVVPGSSFYSSPNSGGNLIRFAFCKTVDPLEGVDRLMSTKSG